MNRYRAFRLIPLLLFFIPDLFAQTIPNGGFENWQYYPNTVYEVPRGWTDNDILYQHFDAGYRGVSVVKTTHSHSGKYALEMGVAIDHNDTVNGGIYSTGSLDSLLKVIYHTNTAGFPCSQRYLSFKGYYIFDCRPGDTAIFGVILTKWNWVTRKRDTIVNSVLHAGNSHPDYVPFVVPLKYRIKLELPDTAFISVGIQSELNRAARVGTILIIDDLEFSGRAPGE